MLAGHSSTVKWQTGLCREHMICPLPRASELSALRAVGVQAIGTQGGADGPRRGRSGAGHETAGSHHAGIEWRADVVAGRDILGMEPRSLRRCRARFEAGGAVALYDRRRLPSPRKAPALEVQRVLRLYRERFTAGTCATSTGLPARTMG